MTFELIVRHGEYAGRSFPIAEGERKTIGLAPNCEISLPGIEGLPRYHCTVENRERQLQVTDLGSLNGTFIDGERVEEGVLRAGALSPSVTRRWSAALAHTPSPQHTTRRCRR